MNLKGLFLSLMHHFIDMIQIVIMFFVQRLICLVQVVKICILFFFLLLFCIWWHPHREPGQCNKDVLDLNNGFVLLISDDWLLIELWCLPIVNTIHWNLSHTNCPWTLSYAYLFLKYLYLYQIFWTIFNYIQNLVQLWFSGKSVYFLINKRHALCWACWWRLCWPKCLTSKQWTGGRSDPEFVGKSCSM